MNTVEKTLDKVESFLNEKANEFPSDIHNYFVDMVKQDRKYLDLVQQWGKEKGILKSPEAKETKY